MAKRPHPLLWLYYLYGGRLPDRYRDWVLHDATSRRWLLRAFVRTMCQALPVIAVLLILFAVFGVPWYFAVGCVVLGLVVSIYYSLSYASESVDSRLRAYGYPPAYASHFRQERYESEHAADAERYRRAWRQER
jgi:MFS family permease